MSFDHNKLKGKIKELYGTQDAFAKALNIGRTSLSQKLNNITDFSRGEMEKACKLLNISKEEISDYFFTIEVQKRERAS